MSSLYSIHDLLTVQSDVDLPIPGYFRTENGGKPDISVEVGPINVEAPPRGKKKRKDYAVWRHAGSLVFDYEVLDLKLMVGTVDGQTEIRATERFVGRSKAHINTLVKLLVQLKLLDEGYTFVHAGAVSMGGEAVLIPALGSTGKTYTTLSLVDGEDSFFMSDDLVILGREGDVLCYPGRIGTGPYRLENFDVPELEVRPLISHKLAKVPLISVIFGKFPWLYKTKNFDPPRSVVAERAEAAHLFMITGGVENDARPMSTAEAVRRSQTQHLDTHSFFSNFILNHYAYFFDYDLADQTRRMREIMLDGLADVNCYEMRANELDRYPEIIDSTLT